MKLISNLLVIYYVLVGCVYPGLCDNAESTRIAAPASKWPFFSIMFDYYDKNDSFENEDNLIHLEQLALDTQFPFVLDKIVESEASCRRLLTKIVDYRVSEDFLKQIIGKCLTNKSMKKELEEEFSQRRFFLTMQDVSCFALINNILFKFYGKKLSREMFCKVFIEKTISLSDCLGMLKFRFVRHNSRRLPLSGLTFLPRNKYQSYEVSYYYTLAEFIMTTRQCEFDADLHSWCMDLASCLRDVDLLVFVTINSNTLMQREIMGYLSSFPERVWLEYLIVLLLSDRYSEFAENIDIELEDAVQAKLEQFAGCCNVRELGKNYHQRLSVALLLVKNFYKTFGELEYEYPLSCPSLCFPEIQPWTHFPENWCGSSCINTECND